MVPFRLSLHHNIHILQIDNIIIFMYYLDELRIKNRHHDIDLISIVHIGVRDYVIVALSIDVDLVVVVVVVIEVIVDVGHNGQNVHGGGQESHLCNVDSSSICCGGTSRY